MILLNDHFVEVGIIDPEGYCLDLGCLGIDYFGFSLALKSFCKNIIAVDPGESYSSCPDGIIFENKAIVSHDEDTVKYHISNYATSNSCVLNNVDTTLFLSSKTVPAISIAKIKEIYNINVFELIKIDIEGGEFDILDSVDLSISKQWSIEFHAHKKDDFDDWFAAFYHKCADKYFIAHEDLHNFLIITI